MKENKDEAKVLEALLKQDGVAVKSLEGTTEEALVALLELLVYKGFVSFQEFGKFCESVIERREENGNKEL